MLGEHVLIDLYACIGEYISSPITLQERILSALEKVNQTVDELDCQVLEDEIFLIAVAHRCHVIVHAYPDLGYVAADIYSFEKNLQTKLFMRELKVATGAERVKSTSIRRGDFGSERDMKPRKRTTITALGRVKRTRTRLKSTGAKMIKKALRVKDNK